MALVSRLVIQVAPKASRFAYRVQPLIKGTSGVGRFNVGRLGALSSPKRPTIRCTIKIRSFYSSRQLIKEPTNPACRYATCFPSLLDPSLHRFVLGTSSLNILVSLREQCGTCCSRCIGIRPCRDHCAPHNDQGGVHVKYGRLGAIKYRKRIPWNQGIPYKQPVIKRERLNVIVLKQALQRKLGGSRNRVLHHRVTPAFGNQIPKSPQELFWTIVDQGITCTNHHVELRGRL